MAQTEVCVQPCKPIEDYQSDLPMGQEPKKPKSSCCQPGTRSYQFYLSYLTLGVIYGDIGTSPLYTLSSIFTSPPAEEEVIGALSAILWTLIVVVLLKYVCCILLADDHGEGGTFALATLLSRGLRKKISHNGLFHGLDTVFALISILGVSAVLADGVLTPAISVMGAVQGLAVEFEEITTNIVVGVSCAILVLFFLPQKMGTARVSIFFSPIIILWFFALAAIGIYNLTQAPHVLKAFSPHHAVLFLSERGFESWANLGAIFLCVTGAEALFADLGHFNANAIRMSCVFVIPSLMLCYCGQAAALTKDPELIANTFYKTIPHDLFYPMLVLATLAAIIASQALVTATFSIIGQAMRLNYVPRLTVCYTDKREVGQIYIPEINYFMMVIVVAVVAGFQNVTALGYAYGITVSLAFLITAVFFAVVMCVHFNLHWSLAVIFFAFFGFVDANFLAANLLKFTTGGWFSIMITLVLATVLSIWRYGRVKMMEAQTKMTVLESDLNLLNTNNSSNNREQSEDLPLLLQKTDINSAMNLMICFSSTTERVPAALVHFLKRMSIRPRVLALVTVSVVDIPYATSSFHCHKISGFDNIYRVIFYHGYAEVPPEASKIAVQIAIEANCLQPESAAASDEEILNTVDPTYVVGKDRVYCANNSSILHRVFVSVFNVLLKVSRSPLASLNLPPERTLEIGVQVAM